MSWLGIDLGTSAVKVLLIDDEQRILDQQSESLDLQRPHPLWSEQDPQAWWCATERAVGIVAGRQPAAMAGVRGIGISGQMHGATLLDSSDRVLRPAILWNDSRAVRQCQELERRAPAVREITGNLVMPGFTAPKLLWVAEHEPEVFGRVARVLLPKDYLRFRLCGEMVSEPSDASGTLWLDLEQRRWSGEMLDATGLSERVMPRLVEGSEPSGTLDDQLARAWGMEGSVTVAGGAGDNAGAAVGVGVVAAGQGLLSLGTSGVYFVAGNDLTALPDRAVHTFCHCLPQTWHQMSVILSAASCLSWWAGASGAGSESVLLDELDSAGVCEDVPIFLPYLSGERTPYNNPRAKGVFFGLDHTTTRAALTQSVLEGVAFALADGQQVLLEAGTAIESVTVVGGGSRSRMWGRILASVLDRPLCYAKQGELGPAFGAARLARLATTGEDMASICLPPPVDYVIAPDADLSGRYGERLGRFRDLYQDLGKAFLAHSPQS